MRTGEKLVQDDFPSCATFELQPTDIADNLPELTRDTWLRHPSTELIFARVVGHLRGTGVTVSDPRPAKPFGSGVSFPDLNLFAMLTINRDRTPDGALQFYVVTIRRKGAEVPEQVWKGVCSAMDGALRQEYPVRSMRWITFSEFERLTK